MKFLIILQSVFRAIVLLAMLGIGSILAIFPAQADQNSDAYAVYNRRDYVTAFKLWRPLAEQGEAYAQVSLGYMYANGQGVAQDYGEAVK